VIVFLFSEPPSPRSKT